MDSVTAASEMATPPATAAPTLAAEAKPADAAAPALSDGGEAKAACCGEAAKSPPLAAGAGAGAGVAPEAAADHSCCMTGTLHVGETKGKEETIPGTSWQVYVARPPTPSTKSIIILADLFGWTLPNARLLADRYATQGFNVWLPDIFEGEVLQPKDWDFLGEQKTTVLGNLWKGVRTMAALPALIAFAKRHCPLKVHPIMEALIGHLRGKEGQTKVGTIGFCFGGKFAITMAATDKIDASVAAHPSFVQVPADIDAIARPILFVCAEHDDVFTKANVAATKKIAAEKAAKGAVFEVKEYAGVAHGFAMRGDDSVPVQRDAREKAFADGLAFFNKQLA